VTRQAWPFVHASRLSAPLAAGRRAATAHPDAAALLLVIGLGLGLRLAFFPAVPVLLHSDAFQYYRPAYALMTGEGFPLPLKRPPLYPAFVALVGHWLGSDLRYLAAVQHLMGLGTVALTYGVGRLTFGRPVGFLSGLAAALSGGLLIYEHSVLTEAPFTFLITLAAFLCVVALRRNSGWWYAASGLTIGLASLTRPHAPVMLLAVAAVVTIRYQRWRPALRAFALAAVAAAAVIIPWMLRNQAVHGTFSVAAGEGQHLVYLTAVLHGGDFVFLDRSSPPDDANPARLAARRIIQEAVDLKAARPGFEFYGLDIHDSLMEQAGLSEAEANRVMREVALDAILARPATYARLAFEDLTRIFTGQPEDLANHWDRHRQSLWQERERLRRHKYPIESSPPRNGQESAFAELAVNIYQSARLGGVIPALFLVGLAASATLPLWRTALLPGLAVLSLNVVAAVTAGFHPRFHHPPDPLMHVVAFGGLLYLYRLLVCLVARLRGTAVEHVDAAPARLAPR
jgi:4-amino-4-deoxy-L-arabinose transferase-like glycosyltransferase